MGKNTQNAINFSFEKINFTLIFLNIKTTPCYYKSFFDFGKSKFKVQQRNSKISSVSSCYSG